MQCQKSFFVLQCKFKHVFFVFLSALEFPPRDEQIFTGDYGRIKTMKALSLSAEFSNVFVSKLCRLITVLHSSIGKMPKFYRYTIGLPVIEKSFSVLDLAMLARTKQGTSQLLIVKKIDVELKNIQLRLRIANEIKAFSDKSHITISESLIELGKIAGGWIKKIEKRD